MHAAVSGRCVYNVCVLPRLVLSVQCADGREDWGVSAWLGLALILFSLFCFVLFYFILFLIFSGRFR